MSESGGEFAERRVAAALTSLGAKCGWVEFQRLVRALPDMSPAAIDRAVKRLRHAGVLEERCVGGFRGGWHS